MSTVEPVFGTLFNFLGERKVNNIRLNQANKCMLMAATAFNLKKLLKYTMKPRITKYNILEIVEKSTKNGLKDLFLYSSERPHFIKLNIC
jgi:hypothetical protein